MKKTLSLIILTALLLQTASCGGGSASTDTTAAQTSDTTEAVTEEVKTDGLPETDMEGFTLNILHHDETWLNWAKTNMTAEEENGELINDEIYKRNTYIEERFNCKLNIEGINQTATVYKSLVQSGSTEYDVIFQYGLNVLGNVDYEADFSQIPYLQLDEEYWNPNATSVFRVGDKQLAIAGNWTLSYLSGATTFCFNKRVFDELNTGKDMYELVRSGKWTTDAFYEIAKVADLDLNGDGKKGGEEDLIGMVGQSKAYWNSLIIGAGFHYVDFDEDHMPSFNLAGNEKMLNFLQKIVDVESANANIYPVSSEMNSTGYKPNNGPKNDFLSGKSLFAQQMIFAIETKLREMEDDFGILPPPKYDEDQEKYYSYANIGEIATLPRSFDMSRSEYIGMLLEAMSFYSQEHIVPAYKETVLQVKLSRDEESSEMLDYVFGNIVFDYGTVVWESAITGPIISNFLMPRSTTLVSTVESIKNTLDGQFETLFEGVENMP